MSVCWERPFSPRLSVATICHLISYRIFWSAGQSNCSSGICLSILIATGKADVRPQVCCLSQQAWLCCLKQQQSYKHKPQVTSVPRETLKIMRMIPHMVFKLRCGCFKPLLVSTWDFILVCCDLKFSNNQESTLNIIGKTINKIWQVKWPAGWQNNASYWIFLIYMFDDIANNE